MKRWFTIAKASTELIEGIRRQRSPRIWVFNQPRLAIVLKRLGLDREGEGEERSKGEVEHPATPQLTKEPRLHWRWFTQAL